MSFVEHHDDLLLDVLQHVMPPGHSHRACLTKADLGLAHAEHGGWDRSHHTAHGEKEVLDGDDVAKLESINVTVEGVGAWGDDTEQSHVLQFSRGKAVIVGVEDGRNHTMDHAFSGVSRIVVTPTRSGQWVEVSHEVSSEKQHSMHPQWWSGHVNTSSNVHDIQWVVSRLTPDVGPPA